MGFRDEHGRELRPKSNGAWTGATRGTTGARTRGERTRVAGAIPPGEAGPSCAPARDRLHYVIRGKLASGEVPHNGIPRIWGAPAMARSATPARTSSVPGSSSWREPARLSVECFCAWDTERDAPERQRLKPGDGFPAYDRARKVIHDDAAVIAAPPDPPAVRRGSS